MDLQKQDATIKIFTDMNVFSLNMTWSHPIETLLCNRNANSLCDYVCFKFKIDKDPCRDTSFRDVVYNIYMNTL